MRILVIEDEASLRDGIVDLFEGDGHVVTAVADGVSGLESGLRDLFELVVLDLMLPRLDGMEVCRRLRAARPGMPILMLTARGSEDDKVRGLVEGADDYVTKPFSARELLARVRALGRRVAPGESLDEVQLADAVIDLARMAVIRGDRCISLTPREVGIVRWLYRHRGRVVSRGELLERVFGDRAPLRHTTDRPCDGGSARHGPRRARPPGRGHGVRLPERDSGRPALGMPRVWRTASAQAAGSGDRSWSGAWPSTSTGAPAPLPRTSRPTAARSRSEEPWERCRRRGGAGLGIDEPGRSLATEGTPVRVQGDHPGASEIAWRIASTVASGWVRWGECGASTIVTT